MIGAYKDVVYAWHNPSACQYCCMD